MSVMQWQHSINKSQNAKTLKDICFKIVSSGSVPKAVITVSVARIKCTLEINKWQNSATIPMETYINHRKGQFKFFSFPEFLEKRQQLEPRTLDPMHVLTNLRAHACKNGFDIL